MINEPRFESVLAETTRNESCFFVGYPRTKNRPKSFPLSLLRRCPGKMSSLGGPTLKTRLPSKKAPQKRRLVCEIREK